MRRTLVFHVAVFGVSGFAAALASTQSLPLPGAAPSAGEVDWSALPTMPKSPINLETCRQMMGGVRQSATALQDTRGARAGDEAMSCQDIANEIGTMQGVGLSDAARSGGSEAATQYQAVVASQLAQMQAQTAAGAAATTAAHAAHIAVQFATADVVNPHAAMAVQQVALAVGRVEGEAMAEQRLFNATGNDTAAMAQQLQSNPRFAGLVSLVLAKNCKEPGDAGTTSPAQRTLAVQPMGR